MGHDYGEGGTLSGRPCAIGQALPMGEDALRDIPCRLSPPMRASHTKRGKTGDITSDDKLGAIKFACMAEVPTDGAARGEPNLFGLSRVVKEEGEANRRQTECHPSPVRRWPRCEPTTSREQYQVCLNIAEARRRKAKPRRKENPTDGAARGEPRLSKLSFYSFDDNRDNHGMHCSRCLQRNWVC